MADRLHRLRHHAVVGGHDQNDDVGNLGAARPQLGECRVARGVDEGDAPTRLCFDLIGADVLSNATRSRAATSVLRRESRREVLPWSTWPMTVTTGGRGCTSAA